MEALGLIIFIIGVLIAAVGGIWLLITGFGESILWGLAMLFIPLVGLIFVILHWDKAKKPFLVNIVGAAIIFVGSLLMGGA